MGACGKSAARNLCRFGRRDNLRRRRPPEAGFSARFGRTRLTEGGLSGAPRADRCGRRRRKRPARVHDPLGAPTRPAPGGSFCGPPSAWRSRRWLCHSSPGQDVWASCRCPGFAGRGGPDPGALRGRNRAPQERVLSSAWRRCRVNGRPFLTRNRCAVGAAAAQILLALKHPPGEARDSSNGTWSATAAATMSSGTGMQRFGNG
jgi:hypothetical protein